ncbi:MAG: T9SS type A sorting domain-containing protein [Bacteroidetes bacterium]|nr:T9SS type A sorting domain-containing protein [Bacteroidota bacterium]
MSSSLNLFPEVGVGDLIDIYATDNWPSWCDHNYHTQMGQINRVENITGAVVSLYDELRLDFSFDYGRNIPSTFVVGARRIRNPAHFVGIENLAIHCANSNNSMGLNNIFFNIARDCRVAGVESYNPARAHIQINNSTGIEIRGCDFHHAKDYGGGGYGYGVSIGEHSSNVLVENNVFSYLRHAMILSSGANGNVFGYNYSRDIYNTYDFTEPEYDAQDVAFHGNFPFANLIEGNIVQFIYGDEVHGHNGPFNTIFRNKIESESQFEDFGKPNGGILIRTDGNYPQMYNVFGNILKDVGDQYYWAPGVLSGSNSKIGLVSDYAGIDDISYYRTSQPAFLSGYTWPTIGCKYCNSCSGTLLPSQDLPAKRRWDASQKRTVDEPQIIYKSEFVLSQIQFLPEGGAPTGGHYLVDGEDKGGSWSGFITSIQTIEIEAVPPPGYVFHKWSDGNTQKIRAISSTSQITMYATFKSSFASSSLSAISTTSQRKFARTTGQTNLHMVYESMGSIWYESSTDNGATWQLMNNNQPISGGTSPAIATVNFLSPNAIFIVYQANHDIILQCFKEVGHSFVHHYTRTVTSIPNLVMENTLANPVIGIKPLPNGAEVCIVWEGTKGLGTPLNPLVKCLKYWYGTALITQAPYEIVSSVSGEIAGSTASSINPTIAVNQNGGAFQVAWQEGTSHIMYNTINATQQQDIAKNVSSGNGFSFNYNPSIIATTSNSYPARLSWVGKRWIDEEEEELQKATAVGHWEYNTVFTDPSSVGSFWVFGSSVNSTNININQADNGYIIAWSKSDGVSEYTRNSSLGGSIWPFKKAGNNIIGRDVQVVAGTSFSDMYGVMLNTGTAPYQFKRSDNITSLGKEANPSDLYNGREGIISQGDAQFYFMLGDITVDGVSISFDELSDTTQVDTKPLVNQYLTSQPFVLTDQSDFSYGVMYGFSDSAACQEVLSQGEVEYKVQLINDNTGAVIGEYDHVRFNQSNVFQYRNLGYQVNTQGIGNATVRLKLVVTTNLDAQYRVSSRHNNQSVTALGKSHRKKGIQYQGSLIVKEYALAQNFPNPFNPVTTINYAIPNPGNVMIKVYDVLGKEVTTLVNHFQETGRYTVSFDASALSSGVYFYKITAGEFSDIKKMMLIK